MARRKVRVRPAVVLPLTARDLQKLAAFFAIHWAVVAIDPRGQRTLRGVLAELGFMTRTGPLKLTPPGKRALATARFDPGRLKEAVGDVMAKAKTKGRRK